MLYPSPALVEPAINRVLNYSLPRVESASWHVQGLSRESVDEHKTRIHGWIRLYLFKAPQMVFRIGVRKAKFEWTLQVHALIAFLTSANPIVCVKSRKVGLYNRKQLTWFLLAKLQQNFLPVLTKHQTCFQVDELKVVDLWAHSLDIEKLWVVGGMVGSSN